MRVLKEIGQVIDVGLAHFNSIKPARRLVNLMHSLGLCSHYVLILGCSTEN